MSDLLWEAGIAFATFIIIGLIVIFTTPMPSEDEEITTFQARLDFLHQVRAFHPSDDYYWLVYHHDLAHWNGEDPIPRRPRLSSRGL